MEIPAVIIACCCWSLPICKKSNLLFWITLDTSDHFHLNWLKVLLLLLPYHMQKTNFITQLILEIKLTHYLLSLWACSGILEHTHLNQLTNIQCFFGPLIMSKNSSSYVKFFLRYCGLKNPVFLFVLSFLDYNSRTRFLQTCCFCIKCKKKTKNIGTLCSRRKAHLNG